MDDLSARLWLLRSFLSAAKITELINHFGSPQQVLAASHAALSACNLKNSTIEKLLSPQQSLIARDLAWAQNDKHQIIRPQDDAYPERLKSINAAPILLFAIGDTEFLKQPQLAMVGSRNPTSAGKQTAFEFARHLSQAGLSITSGLARGIDAACHNGALEGIGGTIAVVANGLHQIYPASHQALAKHISEHGCIISEMPIGTAPHKGLFPRRNRIISGLSIGTLVVEAAKNSGSLITAHHAMEQSRDVFAIPGSIHNPLARGCHSLIKQGAKLVETADDIIEELLPLVNLSASSHTSGLKSAEPPQTELDSGYQKLLDCMEFDPISIDELVAKCEFNAADIASMILILELQGLVTSANGRYTRTGGA